MNSSGSVSDISIISVCYNSQSVLPDMLNSIPPQCPIILVDNASSKPLKLPNKNANITILHNKENLGSGRACNQGAASAKTKFLLFLNPDTTLLENTLDELLDAALRHKKASAFNPLTQNNEGKRSFRKRSVILGKSNFSSPNVPSDDIELPILNGAAIFITKKIFDAVGGFDEKIFLYHEDDDLSLRLKEQYGPLILASKSCVVHLKGQSSDRTPEIAALKAFHMGRSRIYVMRKCGHQFAFSKSLAAALLGASSPVNFFSKRRRAKTTAFLKGVWSARKISV